MAPRPRKSSDELSGDSADSEEEQTAQKPATPEQEDVDDESSTEEEEEEEDEDGSSSSDDEKPEPANPTGSGSESSDTESDTEPADYVIAPISSKPMEPERKPFFKRLFSVDDELTILKSMAEYQEKKGPLKISPSTFAAFQDFLGKSLSIEVSDAKLYDKVRRMKSKFEARSKKGGGRFHSEHDRAVYELSMKVWGNEEVGEMRSRKRKGGVVKEEEEEEEGEKQRKRVRFGLVGCGNDKKREEFRILKEEMEKIGVEGLDGVDKENARRLEKEFKKVRLMEMKLQVERMGLLKESLELVVKSAEKEMAVA